MRRAPDRPVRACFARSCCSVAVQEHDLRATPVQCKHFPHTSHCTLHTPHSTLALHLNSSHLSSSHLIPCLPICQLSSSWLFLSQVLPNTDVYNKSLHKALPSTTKLAQNTSQYYFVLQRLHKALPSTTLYCRPCTNYFPVLLCTTKLAETRSSTTVCYKARTNTFPVLLCTTKLARTT